MNSVPKLSSSDLSTLQNLIDTPSSSHRLLTSEASALREFLKSARLTTAAESEQRASLGSRLVLQAPEQPADTFEFEIVLPGDEDLDSDKLSIARPVCLAALGQPREAFIEWEIPTGTRRMQLRTITRQAALASF